MSDGTGRTAGDLLLRGTPAVVGANTKSQSVTVKDCVSCIVRGGFPKNNRAWRRRLA